MASFPQFVIPRAAKPPYDVVSRSGFRVARHGIPVLVVGAAVMAMPTMAFVARESWSTDQGAHGPIVLATGLWLLWHLASRVRDKIAPAPALRVALLLAVLLPAYVVARVTQIVEIEGYLMYASLLAAAYGVVGGAVMRHLWFPLVYLLFIFPPPETLVALVTLPMKEAISGLSVAFLDVMGYPIAREGVQIYIGQYELLVAAACAGLNSIVSLSAISLFYIYMRHQAQWQYALLLVLFIVPVAMFANFIRVLMLILLTYHAGDAAASGFLHNFAGLVMFAVALLAIFALDALLKPIYSALTRRSGGLARGAGAQK